MYPLNNQLVLNYFQLLFIKTKLEPHLWHSKSSTTSQDSAVISATPAGFHRSSWSGGGHTFKMKINPADTKHSELWSSKHSISDTSSVEICTSFVDLCVWEKVWVRDALVSYFIALLIATAICPAIVDISLIPMGIFVVCSGTVQCLMRISTCLPNRNQINLVGSGFESSFLSASDSQIS